MIFPELQPVQRYTAPLYLGDLHSRRISAERRPIVEIELIRDIEQRELHSRPKRGGGVETYEVVTVVGRGRTKRRGVLNRAVGQTFWLDNFCYHIDEVLAYRELHN